MPGYLEREIAMKRFLIAIIVVAALSLAAVAVISLNSRVETQQKIDGYTERYYFFNKLMGERSYKGGELNGITTTYYSDGKIKAEWTYHQGLRHGPARIYTAEGNLRYEDEYAAGKRISRKEYDKTGNLISG